MGGEKGGVATARKDGGVKKRERVLVREKETPFSVFLPNTPEIGQITVR